MLFILFVKPGFAINAKSIFQKSKNSVVLIKSFSPDDTLLAIGSGFYVTKNKIVTNYHVVKGASLIKIKLLSGEEYKVDFISGLDIDRDLVLLISPVKNTPLALSKRDPIIGEDIIAIGNPKGLESTVSKGVISGIRTTDNCTYYQITSPISPGSSGGVIIDEYEKVVGVSTFYLADGQNLNFAVPSKYLQVMLNNPLKIPFDFVTANTNIKTEDKKSNILGKYFRIHNFGLTELTWFMSRSKAQVQMKKIQLEHDNAGCKNRLGINTNDDIFFVTYGSFDTPHSLLGKNTYILSFRSDSLVGIKWYSEIQNILTDEHINEYLGGRKSCIIFMYNDIVRYYQLQYGKPIWEHLNQKAWSTSTKNIIVDYEFNALSATEKELGFEKQQVIVSFSPKE